MLSPLSVPTLLHPSSSSNITRLARCDLASDLASEPLAILGLRNTLVVRCSFTFRYLSFTSCLSVPCLPAPPLQPHRATMATSREPNDAMMRPEHVAASEQLKPPVGGDDPLTDTVPPVPPSPVPRRELANEERDTARESSVAKGIRRAVALTMTAIVVLIAGERANSFATPAAWTTWVPWLSATGAVVGALAILSTHVMVGRAAFPNAWRLFQPGEGGACFVALQMMAWTLSVVSFLLPTAPFIVWWIRGKVCSLGRNVQKGTTCCATGSNVEKVSSLVRTMLRWVIINK